MERERSQEVVVMSFNSVVDGFQSFTREGVQRQKERDEGNGIEDSRWDTIMSKA